MQQSILIPFLGQEIKEILVNVDKPRLNKPFLGGYRDKFTGKEYHHATAQTLPRRRQDNGVSPFNLQYNYHVAL